MVNGVTRRVGTAQASAHRVRDGPKAVSVEEPGRDPSLVPGNLTCDGGRVVWGTESLCLF